MNLKFATSKISLSNTIELIINSMQSQLQSFIFVYELEPFNSKKP